MEKLIQDLKDPQWWYGIVIIGIILNIVAAIIFNLLKKVIVNYSSKLRIMSNMEKEEELKKIEGIKNNSTLQIIQASYVNYLTLQLIHWTLHTIIFLLILSIGIFLGIKSIAIKIVLLIIVLVIFAIQMNYMRLSYKEKSVLDKSLKGK